MSPVTLTATAAYPYVDGDRAALALRGELRRQAAVYGMFADWSTMTSRGATGGARGRRLYHPPADHDRATSGLCLRPSAPPHEKTARWGWQRA